MALAAWLSSFVAAEGVFRALGDETSSDLAGLYQSFNHGGYKLAPSVDTDAHWSAGRFSVHTDDLGLRTDRARRFAARPGDRLDVLLLGDSQGFGNGLSFEDSLAGRVATAGAERGYRVANASVGGHGLQNQLDVMRWLRDVHHVTARNYVVLMTPVLISNADSYTRAAVGEDGHIYQHAPGPTGRTVSWMKTHTVLYSRLRGAVRNLGIGATPEAANAMVFQIYAAGPERIPVATSFVAGMRAIQTFASEVRAAVQIVYVPLTVEVDSATLLRAATANGLALDLNGPFRLCATVATKLEMPLVDLRPVLQTLHSEGGTLQLIADFHYNAKLSHRAATSLWPQLQSSLQPATRRVASNHE